ncbi:outer membrane protein assembly factor BamB family protein [Plantactinospora sp. DSM 117369]
MRNLDLGLRWLGHPGTVAATVLLLVNDHLLKACWPGPLTGKVSDFAGLVVAPAVLGGGLAAAFPVRRGRLLVAACVISTGLGFALVKLTAPGAALASAVWSSVAGPSRVLADPTDLVALPALGLAWWIGRRTVVRRTDGDRPPAGTPRRLTPLGLVWALNPFAPRPRGPHAPRLTLRPTARHGEVEKGSPAARVPALLGRVRVLVAVPLALFAVAATTAGGEPDADPTVGVAQREAAWSTSLPSSLGIPSGAAVSGDRVVVVTEPGGMAVLDRHSGVSRWQREASSGSQQWRRIQVTRDAVLIFLDNAVQVLDLDTGRLARETAPVTGAAASWTTLFLSTCEPRCAIRAYDIGSGRLRWTHTRQSRSRGADVPAYWTELSADPAEAAPARPGRLAADRLRPLTAGETRVLIAGQYQGNGAYRTLALDAGTGKVLSEGATLADGERFTVGDDRSYLRWRTADPCEFAVTGYDVRGGAAKWTARIRPPGRDVATQPCDAWVPQVAAGALLAATPEGRPQALDLATGRVRWNGDNGTSPLATVGDVVVTRHDGQRRIAGHDLGTGDRRWISELPEDGDGGPEWVHRTLAAGERLGYQTTYQPAEGPERELTWVRHAVTGRVEWVGKGSNELLGAGGGALVTRGLWIHGDPPADRSAIQVRLFTL